MSEISLLKTLEMSKNRFDGNLVGGYKLSKKEIIETSNQVALKPESRSWIKDVLETILPENGEDNPQITLSDVVFERKVSTGEYNFEVSFETKTGRIDFDMGRNGKPVVTLTYFGIKSSSVGRGDFERQKANKQISELTEDWERITDHKERAAIIGTFLLPALQQSE